MCTQAIRLPTVTTIRIRPGVNWKQLTAYIMKKLVSLSLLTRPYYNFAVCLAILCVYLLLQVQH